MILDHINDIASICAGHGVTTAIISPGSRSAPITLAFVRHPEIQTKVIPDERSAAFIAHGMAQQQNRPVVLVCTSGSAAYNYAPAIAEAFYQEVPLIVLTADRPPEWVDQYDGQTIRQSGIYGGHVKGHFDFPVCANHPDAIWHCNRIVNEALISSQSNPQGPVHINIPLREPFYPESEEYSTFNDVRIIRPSRTHRELRSDLQETLLSEWNNSPNRAIVIGQHHYSDDLIQLVHEFSSRTRTPVITDIISNHQDVEGSIKQQDLFLNAVDTEATTQLAPELLITFGKSLISKNLKKFLRKNPAKTHWHIGSQERLNDSLQSMTRLISIEPNSFFETFKPNTPGGDFKEYWQQLDLRTQNSLSDYLQEVQFSELKAVAKCLVEIPNSSQLHLANSMAVRYANFIGLAHGSQIKIFANRGTSGIDGSNSTAVGAALNGDDVVTLITGDMAFFYDRNAFWHNYNLKNLRIVVLNNHAGGIFRMIDGPSSQPEFEEYFETVQNLDAKHLANEFGFEYHLIKNDSELDLAFKSFYDESANAKILEIETSSAKNAEVIRALKQKIKTEI